MILDLSYEENMDNSKHILRIFPYCGGSVLSFYESIEGIEGEKYVGSFQLSNVARKFEYNEGEIHYYTRTYYQPDSDMREYLESVGVNTEELHDLWGEYQDQIEPFLKLELMSKGFTYDNLEKM